MIAEYWANGPRTELPPGHWDLFGEFVHAVTITPSMMTPRCSLLDERHLRRRIAAWDAKRGFTSVRPHKHPLPLSWSADQILAPFQRHTNF